MLPSAHTGRRHPEADELEQPPRPVRVGVLVEDALARAPTHLLRLPGVGDELAIGRDRLVRALDDDELASRLEPALDPLVRVRDDRRARGGELEGPRGRRARDGRMRTARDVQVDAGGGDRAGEDVERDVAEQARRAGVALEVEAPEREVELGREPGRLADHRLHPVAPELVPVAVEEHVQLLLDRLRREELGIGAPEERLRATCAELEEPRRSPPSEFETTRSYSNGSAPWYGLKPVSIPPYSGRLMGTSPS